jgi:hypothetical protein
MDSCAALFIMIGDASHYSFDKSSSISTGHESGLISAEVQVALGRIKELIDRLNGSLNIDPRFIVGVCEEMRFKLEKEQCIVMGYAVSKKDVFMMKF